LGQRPVQFDQCPRHVKPCGDDQQRANALLPRPGGCLERVTASRVSGVPQCDLLLQWIRVDPGAVREGGEVSSVPRPRNQKPVSGATGEEVKCYLHPIGPSGQDDDRVDVLYRLIAPGGEMKKPAKAQQPENSDPGTGGQEKANGVPAASPHGRRVIPGRFFQGTGCFFQDN